MSPRNVSLQLSLGKRNHLGHRYQMPFAGLLTYILLPSFFQPACHLADAGETFGNVPSQWSNAGNHECYGIEHGSRYISQGL
ncbi:unnamed protein product [Protopolystoma xenopodis]|uniref:Uncharacterized protein n=1 Tax=Protopolystoma xenopodis TaxID=117903 RepID=A0A448WGQ6_9PLAT|nr:unnamed protein product [Protopolystoma xenopodis]